MDALRHFKLSDRLGSIRRFVNVGGHIVLLSPRVVPPGNLGVSRVPDRGSLHVAATVVLENTSDKQTGRMSAD
jgi:hypothetical protein